MRHTVSRKLIIAAATSSGLLGLIGYPALRSVYPIKNEPVIIDDYVDLPTATADLTNDIVLLEGIGTGTDAPINISHRLLLSLLKSKDSARRERALNELARQRRWSDAECVEIAQALDRQDIIHLSRTVDADLRLFLRPPSISKIEGFLEFNKIDKVIKTILKDVANKPDSCSSCTNFYTNLSIRVRPDSNVLAMSDLNQVDKMMHTETKRRKKIAYNKNVIRLKAILNNIICGEERAEKMVKSGILLALFYFRHKYKDDIQVNSLLSQILASLSASPVTRDYIDTNGWIQVLVDYTRSEHLEVSLPAFKALANLDDEVNATYNNHIYLLAPLYRDKQRTTSDVIFVHGLVGSVFKSWRQGSIALDEEGNRCSEKNFTPTTELLPVSPSEDLGATSEQPKLIHNPYTRCWPKDWLPQDIPGIRVLALDYPTALSNWRTDCDLNEDSLRQRAIHVMKQLEAANVGESPVVWVTHSMGGLLVKQILVLCDEWLRLEPGELVVKEVPMSRKFLENLYKQTKGVVFYSTPHKGSNLDWIERRNLQKLLMLTTEVIELQKGSPLLIDLHDRFLRLINRPDKPDLKFMTFAEKSISSFGVNKVVQWRGTLVHEDSLQFEVGPVYKLDIDHAHTCKPHNKEAITYKKTLKFIEDLIDKKPRADEDLMPFMSFIL